MLWLTGPHSIFLNVFLKGKNVYEQAQKHFVTFSRFLHHVNPCSHSFFIFCWGFWTTSESKKVAININDFHCISITLVDNTVCMLCNNQCLITSFTLAIKKWLRWRNWKAWSHITLIDAETYLTKSIQISKKKIFNKLSTKRILWHYVQEHLNLFNWKWHGPSLLSLFYRQCVHLCVFFLWPVRDFGLYPYNLDTQKDFYLISITFITIFCFLFLLQTV